MWPAIITDVRWMVLSFTLLSCLEEQLVSSSSFSCGSNIIIAGNSTFNREGEITSTDFPAHYDPAYTCTFRFQSLASEQYVELIFTDFILQSQVARPCLRGRYSVTITQTAERRMSQFCERPKRQVFALSEEGSVEFQSWQQNALKSFRATYRFLERTKGERLWQQTTNEEIVYNYDSFENYQGSIKDETIPVEPEEWVDKLHYITAPPGHKIALTVTFMQQPEYRTTMLEIHDGDSSLAYQLASLTSQHKAVYSSSQQSLYARVYGLAQGSIMLDIDFTFFTDLGANQLCSSDYFQCISNDHCIPSKLVCNGVDNCYDGTSDEDPKGECKGGDNSCADKCQNGGVCIEEGCQCFDGYDGLECEIDNTGDGTDYTDLQHTSIMIGAFVGAVCLLSICWLIAMARKRQTDVPHEGRLHRIISVHSPEEGVGRRQSTLAQANVELPPNYSEAILYRDGSVKGGIRRGSRNSRNEPMSPPPSYDAVASDNDDDGIVFRIPETVHEDDSGESNDSISNVQADRNSQGLPDVVMAQESNPPITRHDTPV